MWKMIADADGPARRTLLGAALIKFATGLAVIWGTINIYFFSALKHQGAKIDQSTSSIVLLIALIPSSFAMLAANPFSRLVGYKFAVRIAALLFILSPMVLNYAFNMETFAVFWLVIPLIAFCLESIPVLNCLWTQFPRDLNKVSGIAILFFSLGMIFWNFVFLFIVNPHNIQAEIDANGLPIFPKQVSDNTLMASNIVYLFAGVCNIGGSFLISKRNDSSLEEKINDHDQEAAKKLTIVQNYPVIEIERAASIISEGRSSEKVQTLLQGLKDKKFLLLCGISVCMPIYLIYLMLNLKLIYMPIINDDYFLSICAALVTVSTVVGAPLWGYIGDIKGFKFSLMVLVLADCLVKLFGIYCTQKWHLVLLFFLLGMNDKGMLTIIGPGLVGMFGVQMATELIPYKGIAVFLAYVIAPVCQIFLSNLISHRDLLIIYLLFSLIGLGLCWYLNFKVHYTLIDPADPQKNRRELELKNMNAKQ